MRSIKELLQVMLDNQHLFCTGLCHWASDLYSYKEIINDDEHVSLRKYIKEHRPSSFSSLNAWKARKHDYYWENGKIEPRIKWINKHIKKLK